MIEASEHGSGEHSGTVLGLEGVEDGGVVVAALNGGHELGAHVWGGGTAEVIAFTEQLVAAATAHDAVTEAIEAGAVWAVTRRAAGSGEDEYGQEQRLNRT